MLIGFEALRRAKVQTSLREFLDLLEALKSGVVFADMDEFYFPCAGLPG